MAEEKRVKILPKGPYKVSKSIPLAQAIIVDGGSGAGDHWEEGRAYGPHERDYNLCRCGHSMKKPYCDGAHTAKGFQGQELASKAPFAEQVKVYEGEKIDLLDNESLCAVACFCDGTPDVWDATTESGEHGMTEIAIQKACKCPSGRLVAAEKDGTLIEPKLNEEIGLVEDVRMDCKGPIWVKGGIPIEGADGEIYEIRNRVTLCRCGNSQNMPFCDASHLEAPHMKGLDE